MDMRDNPHRVAYKVRSEAFQTPEQVLHSLSPTAVAASTHLLVSVCHQLSLACGWYHDPKTGEPLPERNVGEMLMLMVSEISEGMEAHRKGLMDDKLPHRLGIEVELADAMIRICDFAGRHGLDLGGALTEKLAYNATRADHKPENRAKEGGKAY